MASIQLHDKTFERFIPFDEIQRSIGVVASRINHDYKGKKPLLVAVLNGSFMFAAELMKQLDIECEISFVKLASYHGVTSGGSVTELIGLSESSEGRDVIIVEDIVDTGLTIEKVMDVFVNRKCNSVKVASLLFKPEAYKGKKTIDYVAIEIPNKFIVGFGLDYNGIGRNLKDIYQLKTV
ncbi:MAG: hypoxanthine phosphoribosyltransferase [Flavobacteriales bacterium]